MSEGNVLQYDGPFRVYFSPEHRPRFVAISNGARSWEVFCKSVKIIGAPLGSEPPSSSSESYFEGNGSLVIDGEGCAVIRK